MTKKQRHDASIQDIRMLDWYAGFILMRLSNLESDSEWTASEVFDRAEAMMKERGKRIKQLQGESID